MRRKLFSIVYLMLLTLAGYAQRQQLLTAQYAGSIGYMSFGGGVSSKSGKLSHELLYGFVPKAYGGPLDKLTYRLTFTPYKLAVSRQVTWQPFNPVLFVAYNFGSDYSLQQSYKKYDDDYYWWSPALRLHGGANSSVTFSNKEGNPRLQLYLEANTNDRYVVTYWDNTTNMKAGDIFFLGIGARFYLDKTE